VVSKLGCTVLMLGAYVDDMTQVPEEMCLGLLEKTQY
jgi:hypothetical protein